MEKIIIAVGSNLGNRLENIQKAGKFLSELSVEPVKKASIWESEAVGGAKFRFYNSAAEITTSLPPAELLGRLKDFEQKCGREKNPARWGPRILDLDIIHYGSLVIQKENLIIPHREYTKRLFVLLPVAELNQKLKDPVTHTPVSEFIEKAPEMEIQKTDLHW